MLIDRFDYNQAIVQSTNEQMLLNMVRLRYSEPPVFLAVNSVLTQYIYPLSLHRDHRDHRRIARRAQLVRRRQRESPVHRAVHDHLHAAHRAGVQAQELMDQLKDAIGMARDRSRFRVTTRIIERGPDEVTVRVRSMLELMGFLSRGVQIPMEHVEQDRAVRLAGADDARGTTSWFNSRHTLTNQT